MFHCSFMCSLVVVRSCQRGSESRSQRSHSGSLGRFSLLTCIDHEPPVKARPSASFRRPPIAVARLARGSVPSSSARRIGITSESESLPPTRQPCRLPHAPPSARSQGRQPGALCRRHRSPLPLVAAVWSLAPARRLVPAPFSLDTSDGLSVGPRAPPWTLWTDSSPCHSRARSRYCWSSPWAYPPRRATCCSSSS